MTVYVAELLPADYASFREKDPSLPDTHAEWQRQTLARCEAIRRSGGRPALRPIHFTDFRETVEILHWNAWDQSARDQYALESAEADRASSRYR